MRWWGSRALVWLSIFAYAVATRSPVPTQEELANCPHGWPHGTKNINVGYHASLYPAYCRTIPALYNSSDISVTIVDERSLVGDYYGRWYSEDQLLVLEDLLRSGSTALEVIEFDEPWVGVLQEYMKPVDLNAPQNVGVRHLATNNHGEVIGYPKAFNLQVMVYREDLFRKYGYTSWPSTWDEFDEAVRDIQYKERKARNSSNFYGFTVATDDSSNAITYTLVSVLSGDGGGGIVEDDGHVSINNPRAVRSMLRWRQWLREVSPPEAWGWDDTRGVGHFLEGNSLVCFMWVDQHKLIQSEQNKSWNDRGWKAAIGPIPGEAGAGCSGIWYIGMTKFTQYPEYAQLFLTTSLDALMVYPLTEARFPLSSTFMNNSELRGTFCLMWPILCESFDRFPEFWERASYRPSRGCGEMYPFCADVVYRNMLPILRGQVTPEEGAAKMERELLTLLGQWEERSKAGSDPLSGSRLWLVVVAVVGFGILVGAGVFALQQLRAVRRPRGCSLPVALVLSSVVLVSLMVVLPGVIAHADRKARTMSSCKGAQVNREAVRGVAATVHSVLTNLLVDRSPSQARRLGLVTVKNFVGRLELFEGSMIVVLDRSTGEVLLSTDPSRQKERVIAPDGATRWLAAALESMPTWDQDVDLELVTHELRVDGKTVFLLAESIAAEAESAFDGSNRLLWLVLYLIPEEAVLGEAQSLLDDVLDFSITMGIVSLLLAVLCALLITSPLLRLTCAVEMARIMKLDEIRFSGSIITEVAAVRNNFSDLCADLRVYKAFIPKTVFESDDDAAELYKSTNTLKKALAFEPLVLIRPMVATTTTAVLIRAPQFSETGFSVGVDAFERVLEVVEELGMRAQGLLHQVTAGAPGSVLITWNAQRIEQAELRATALGAEVLDRFPQEGLCISAATGRSKVGHVGCVHTRGYGVLGPMVGVLCGLQRVAEEIGGSRGVVVTHRFYDKVSSRYTGRAVDILWFDPQRILVYVVAGREGDGLSEWMYGGDDQLTAQMQRLFTKTSCLAEVRRALADTTDPLTNIILARLRRLPDSYTAPYKRAPTRSMTMWAGLDEVVAFEPHHHMP
eukprot:Sspe_Gene.41556::Locus_20110_Transcript_1_1_Confidence_1.000_Length_3484::g.41556::m.41556